METITWTKHPYDRGVEYVSSCDSYFILVTKNDIKHSEFINGMEIHKKNKDYYVYVCHREVDGYLADTLKILLINDFMRHIDHISSDPGITFGFDTKNEADVFVATIMQWIQHYSSQKHF